MHLHCLQLRIVICFQIPKWSMPQYDHRKANSKTRLGVTLDCDLIVVLSFKHVTLLRVVEKKLRQPKRIQSSTGNRLSQPVTSWYLGFVGGRFHRLDAPGECVGPTEAETGR